MLARKDRPGILLAARREEASFLRVGVSPFTRDSFDNIPATYQRVARKPAAFSVPRKENKDRPLASRTELSEFLASVERRAFRQALFAVRDEEAALDICQDAMMRLAERYGDKPPAELPLLFQRILQNAVRDFFRRRKVRSVWTILFSSLSPHRDDDDADPLETLEIAAGPNQGRGPAERFEQAQLVDLIEREIQRLPARQREAFLLRYWEELDVAETAAVMGCSEGSVKTHCSRAAHTLAAALRAKGIES